MFLLEGCIKYEKYRIRNTIELLSYHAPLPCWRMGKYKKEYNPKIKTQKTFMEARSYITFSLIFCKQKKKIFPIYYYDRK